MDCIFCKIIKGEIPSYKVYEDDNVMAFLDINPTTCGHTLVIPKEHTLDIRTANNETLNNMLKVIKKLSKEYEKKLGIDGFSLCQNNGISQEVKHFHIHLIPRYKNKNDLSIEEVYKKITM